MRRHVCGARWRRSVRRSRRPPPRCTLAAADYVQILAQKLAEADHPVSTRRAGQIVRNIIAVHATLNVLAGACTGLSEDAFYTAVRYSLPDEGWGDPVPQATLLTAHRTAWQLVKLDAHSEVKAILIEPDAVRRIALTLTSSLTGGDAGRIVVDAFSSLPRLARLATAAVLAPLLAQRTDLPAATIEPIARDFSRARRPAAPSRSRSEAAAPTGAGTSSARIWRRSTAARRAAES